MFGRGEERLVAGGSSFYLYSPDATMSGLDARWWRPCCPALGVSGFPLFTPNLK